MKQGWEYKKFTDVCNVQYGYAFDSKCFTDDKNAMPLIRIRDVMRGYSETFYNGDIPEDYIINEGDYLVGMDGEFNIGRWGKRPGLLNQRVCKTVSSSKQLDNQYMYYFMKICLKSIEDETPFVTVKHLSAKRINKIQIPLPPLPIQQSIVAELDEINNLLSLKRKELETYDKLAQSLFYEMFGDPVENEKGWEVKKLGEIATFKNGLNFGKNESGYSYKILGVGDFKDNFVVQSSSLDYINLDNELDSDYFLESKDIIFVRSNGSKELVGRCVSVDCREKTTFSGFCIRCRICSESVTSLFLLYICKNKRIREYLTQSGRGCNISNVNQKILNTTSIILPPLPLQQLFAQRIEAIEEQKAQVKAAIEKLETLLAARMQYWFE